MTYGVACGSIEAGRRPVVPSGVVTADDRTIATTTIGDGTRRAAGGR